MLTFKDFMPRIQQRRFGMAVAYESIYEVLTRVNRWIEQEQIEVFNVETLLLPKLPGASEESPPARMTGAGDSSGTFQSIRIWYRNQAPSPAYMGVTKQLSATEQDNDS